MSEVSPAVAFTSLLADDDRAALESLGRQRRYRSGATLFSEGDRSDHVLLLVEGRVKVFCTTADGREPLLAVRGPGDLLGELAAIDGGEAPRTASVVAMEPVVVREMSAAVFHEFLATSQTAAIALLRSLTARLRGADRRRVEFGAFDVPHRLAHLLIELAERHGVADGSSVRIDLALTQSELADMIGASRESVARALHRMRTAGLIQTGRRHITIIDPGALAERREG